MCTFDISDVGHVRRKVMILGAKLWDDKSTYYSQLNNPLETFLKKLGVKGWLETCGPTAAINCLAALGYDLTIKYPGGWEPQPESVLEDWLNDPRNYPEMKLARPNLDPSTYPGNRIPQYYPIAVMRVFGKHGQYIEGLPFEIVCRKLEEGCTVQLCLIEPGHFIGAVAYDKDTNEIIYRDPWKGFNLRMGSDMFINNTKKFCIIYT
jgi:hypothetical protein